MARVSATELYCMIVLVHVGCTCAFSLGRWIMAPPRSMADGRRISVVTPTWLRRSARSLHKSRRTEIARIRRDASSPSSSSTVSAVNLSRVHTLTTWLKTADPVATLDECIQLALFDGNLRGIQWTCPIPSQDEVRVVASIPARKVLQSRYPSPTWDAQLALQILDEHRQGPASAFYPYVDFLTSGQPFSVESCPASLAPHAIRHWTTEQLASLANSIAGRRLLELRAEQDSLWRAKYEALRQRNSREIPTWEQFCWAMEAVHSRAYIGASMESASTASLGLAAAPTIFAALIGLFYADNVEMMVPPLVFWSSLAVMAALPLISSLLRPPPKSAVMLPLIDVANHHEDAKSSIRFAPLSNSFELVVDLRRCVDQADAQLFVSYGGKSDIELLLNHGFIPNDASLYSSERGSVKVANGCINFGADDDHVRYELAKKFSIRNADGSITT